MSKQTTLKGTKTGSQPGPHRGSHPGSFPGSFPDKSERQKLLTVYGRNPVLEALSDSSLSCQTLHLADSNRSAPVLDQLVTEAAKRGVSVREHSREALSRISRNKKQDQGVALDVYCPQLGTLDDYLAALPAGSQSRLLALDGVTNPQNFGMALRSATAAGVDGILLARRGTPALGPLVLKASAGSAFRAPLLHCASIFDGVTALLAAGFTSYRLSADAAHSLYDQTFEPVARSVCVLGGESTGVSPEVRKLPGVDLSIPMVNGVESLNVAVTAGLVVFELMRRSHRA